MRVTTDMWVSALLRRAFSAGGFAAVLRKGASEAGAVFVMTRDRLGNVRLFGPAPQVSYDEGRPQDRLFQHLPGIQDDASADRKMEREISFDPDLWLVELEADETFVLEALGITTT